MVDVHNSGVRTVASTLARRSSTGSAVGAGLANIPIRVCVVVQAIPVGSLRTGIAKPMGGRAGRQAFSAAATGARKWTSLFPGPVGVRSRASRVTGSCPLVPVLLLVQFCGDVTVFRSAAMSKNSGTVTCFFFRFLRDSNFDKKRSRKYHEIVYWQQTQMSLFVEGRPFRRERRRVRELSLGGKR